MSNKQLFEAFSDEQQAEYEKEIMQKYDPATVRASVKKWKEYATAEKKRIGEEGNAVYKDILTAMPKGHPRLKLRLVLNAGDDTLSTSGFPMTSN